MNRAKRVAKLWKQDARPYATQIKEHNRKVRNGRRKPKALKDPNKI